MCGGRLRVMHSLRAFAVTDDVSLQLATVRKLRAMLQLSLSGEFRAKNCQAIFCNHLLQQDGMSLLTVRATRSDHAIVLVVCIDIIVCDVCSLLRVSQEYTASPNRDLAAEATALLSSVIPLIW